MALQASFSSSSDFLRYDNILSGSLIIFGKNTIYLEFWALALPRDCIYEIKVVGGSNFEMKSGQNIARTSI
jgi:hypothetical protein